MILHVQSWVREIAGLPPEAEVQVHEEAHCQDPTCPLRRTIIQWADTAGKNQRTFLVKPLTYVRRADVERALRLFAATRPE